MVARRRRRRTGTNPRSHLRARAVEMRDRFGAITPGHQRLIDRIDGGEVLEIYAWQLPRDALERTGLRYDPNATVLVYADGRVEVLS